MRCASLLFLVALVIGCSPATPPETAPARSPARPADSIVMANAPFMEGVDLAGAELQSFELSVANPREACRQRCVALDGCRAFTLIRVDEGAPARCSLKSDIPAPVPTPGATSGVVRP